MIRLPASQHKSEGVKRERFRGQTLVEFALVLPIMLLILFVIIELARQANSTTPTAPGIPGAFVTTCPNRKRPASPRSSMPPNRAQ
jgi:hypothetical protein